MFAVIAPKIRRVMKPGGKVDDEKSNRHRKNRTDVNIIYKSALPIYQRKYQ